jgi:uncharacterized membrane protein YjfL (UPF0719 family)
MAKSTSHTTPKDVFYHLLMIVTLYVSVISFIALIFSYVNYAFPGLYFFEASASSGLIFSSAALIIAWPVYILMSWLIGRDAAKTPAKREFKVRKWLLYLTLFVAAITIIIDLITLTYNFLSGEFTISFFLKVITVLLVTGAVFGYYLWELRRTASNKSMLPKMFAWVASAIVVITFVSGFFVVGTPAEQRNRRIDQERVYDLQSIQGQVLTYWQQKNELPPSIDSLRNELAGFVPPVDPETDRPYEYRVTGELTFELCATFATELHTDGKLPPDRFAIYPVPGGFDEVFDHGIGRTCFERTIDPELFDVPPFLEAPAI